MLVSGEPLDRYKVNDVYPTIQGEGMLTGHPMVLIRLQGCDVGCPWCDTKETWEAHPQNERTHINDVLGTNGLWGQFNGYEIGKVARELAPRFKWVLITGGEPAQQPLGDLVRILKEGYGFKVALETSGTAIGFVGSNVDHVTVSPKIRMNKQIIPLALWGADEIKMVVGKQQDIDDLDQLLATTFVGDHQFKGVISLQPLSQNKKATELCLQTAMERGWNISVQTHKYLDVR